MNRGSIKREVRRRLPKILMNVAVAFLFWVIGQIGPFFVKDLPLPGISMPPPFNSISSIIGTTATLIATIFIVKAILDGLFFVDLSAEIITRFLGIREKKPLKRIGRDIVYILLALLITAASSPILSSIPNIGGYLTTTVGLVALGIFLILIYDIGKVIRDVLRRKAKRMADWISGFLEEKENRRR
ncbi:hypothetical protein DRO64_01590 [Candidatus Bathyarchaeota archaeon]|nr:MAG: hypothetical protein DRO64_01590 [Candidatus Bathyarchaeota archaeon]